jgi:hypothetical protein
MHGIGADACHARVRESVVRRRKATLTSLLPPGRFWRRLF